jgi:general stress protein CsbA
MRHSSPLRLVSVVLAVVLIVTFATPARAEAEFLTTITIVSLIVAGVIVLAVVLIANLKDPDRAELGRVVRLACLGDGCAGILGEPAALVPSVEVQAP